MADKKQLLVEMKLEDSRMQSGLKRMNKGFGKAEKKSSSFFKKMKLGYLASAAALYGVIRGISSLIKKASDAQETISKFNTVYRDIQGIADNTAKSLARSFGLSSVKAKELLGDTGDLLTGFGFTQESALDLSKQVNELAVDLASFTNYSGGAEGASKALTKALLGERESVKELGIAILEEDVQAKIKAMEVAGEFTDETIREKKAMATLKIAVEQSGNAVGDFARTQSNFANQTRVLKSRLSDVAIAIGQKLLPAVNNVAGGLIELFTPAKDIDDITYDLIESQTSYKEVVDKLNDSQSDLSKSEKELLTIRKDVLKLDIIRQVNELNKLYDKQTETVEKTKNVSDTYKEALDGISEALVNASKEGSENVELTAKQMRLIQVSGESINRQGDALVDLSDAQRAHGEALEQTVEATTKYNDENTKLNNSIDGIAKSLNDEIIAEEQLISLNPELMEQIRTRRKELLLESERIKKNNKLKKGDDSEDDEGNEERKANIRDYYSYVNDQRQLDIQAEKDAFEAALANEQLTQEQREQMKAQHEQKMTQLESDSAKAKYKIRKWLEGAEIEQVQSTLGNISSLMQTENESLFKIGKASAVAQAIMNTALAVTKTMTSTPFPLNIPLAAAQGIAGAVQVAKIKSQKMPKKAMGGVIDEVAPANISGEDGTIAVQRGESILTREATAVLGRDAINQINAGRMPTAISIGQVVASNPEEFVSQMNDYLKTYGGRLSLEVG